MISHIANEACVAGLRVWTRVKARWAGCKRVAGQRIFCVNHTSHLDFLLLRAALPPSMRRSTRPVAAADYWNRSQFRRYVIREIFQGVLIDRSGSSVSPLEEVNDALARGESLIYFPEGTRGPGQGLLPLKVGVYYLAKDWPGVDLVPVWIDNAYRVLPKGKLLPLPVHCTVTFGAPLRLAEGEARDAFLGRLSRAMLQLRMAG